MMNRRLALACVVAFAFGHNRSEAFCGLRSGDGDDGGGDFVTCLKAKAIATLDRISRDDTLPLTKSITLVRIEPHGRRQRSDQVLTPAVNEQELWTKPADALDAMLYDKTIGLFSGRVIRIGFPELTSDQLRTTLEEGRGKMKKTMGMMMTAAAMKAMMIIPLALGLLFLMAGKAMIISKIALVLSLIITLKKLISKSSEHVVHESHTASASAWPSAGSSIGYGGGGGWDKRSSPTASQILAYSSYKP